MLLLLGILGNTSGPEADRKCKSITKVFKECGLSITCEVNKKIVDFLDVCFNLNDQTYEPYRKPSNDPVYINKHSNHPTNIINEVPRAISKRLTSISCNKNVFDRNIGKYNTALKNSGFDQTLTQMNKMNQQVIALTKKVTKRGNASEILYGTTHHTL